MQWKSLCIGVILAMIVLPSVASAQTPGESTASAVLEPLPQPDSGLNLTLSPVTVQLTTKPGEATRSEIKIRNNGTETEELQIQVVPFEADATGSKPVLREPRASDTYLTWVKLSEASVRIEPGEWKTIDYVFDPPADAALSYFFALQVQRRTHDTPGGATAVTGAPAILVLATVDSPFARRELRLGSFRVKSGFLEFLPQSFSIEIENPGNVHTIPIGNIFIDSQRGKDIAVLPLNPNRLSILPDTKRSLEVAWEDGFPRYETTAKTGTKLTWDFSTADRLRFGRYSAHLIMVYDNGERDVPIESTVSFWVIPLRLILGLLLIPTLPALLVFVLMRLQLRRTRRDSPPVSP